MVCGIVVYVVFLYREILCMGLAAVLVQFCCFLLAAALCIGGEFCCLASLFFGGVLESVWV